MLPLIEEKRDVLFVDDIYLSRKACVLICRDEEHVLGWYLCRQEHSGAWISLLKRIAAPQIVVSDGGTGFSKALKKAWPGTRHQRCLFHFYSQVGRYTTGRPQTAAGRDLLTLAIDLLHVETKGEVDQWVDRFIHRMTYKEKLEDSIPTWGDAIVWGDFHKSSDYPVFWD